jgi:hypothetical protein
MSTGDDLDHDPPVFDALHGLIARIDTQLLTDRLLDRDLTALTYSAGHDMHYGRCSYLLRQYIQDGGWPHRPIASLGRRVAGFSWMPQRQRTGLKRVIGAMLTIAAVVGIYAFITTDAVGGAGRAVAGLFTSTDDFLAQVPPDSADVEAQQVQTIDGFPIGNPTPCVQHCAEWTQLARTALDQRDPNHAEIAVVRMFNEGHIPDLYGPGVLYTRSGRLTVVVFDLADGSVRATGVYCGVGGCVGWGEFPR